MTEHEHKNTILEDSSKEIDLIRLAAECLDIEEMERVIKGIGQYFNHRYHATSDQFFHAS